MNKMDYKVNLDGKDKVFHANLLRRYYERDEVYTRAAAVAVIDEDDSIEDGVIEEKNLLQLATSKSKESYKDVKIGDSLNKEQKKEITDLVYEYRDIFTEIPGTTDLGEHTIDVTMKEAVRVRQYPMPYSTRQIIKDEVQNMLEYGVIEPSTSPYNSPVVLVRKKDDTYRFCIDFRRLNAITKFDTEPMGNQEDLIAKLRGDKYFTKLDLSKGYWQIPVAESSRPMTAFTTPEGCFQFKKLPFGLINSGATFNRVMRKLLKNAENADNYVDDILGHTVDWQEHMSMLRDVFDRIRQAELTLRPSKCTIGCDEVDFVGHKISNGQVEMDITKLDKIKDASQPQTKKEVRSFLGLAGYYRKFIPNFAEVAVPLTDLTKGGQPRKVQWGPSQEKSFQTLKEMLTQAPILRLPDFSRQFIVQTDASDTGVGAALLQDFDDGRFPVAYASKKLLPRERNYSVIERECLAIVFAVQKYQKYLYGTEFILHTDHRPLTYIQKCKTESARIMRWSLFLQNYSFRIESIKGTENVAADYLSRL